MRFASPTAALAQVVECLTPACLHARVHTGSLNSGRTLGCCDPAHPGEPSCLLRVEDGSIRTPIEPKVLGLSNCDDLVLEILVTYSECFMTQTPRGGTRSADALTGDGLDLTLSRWNAIRRIACCRGPEGQTYFRYDSSNMTTPQGNCAGWEMRLEADLSLCGCDEEPTVSSSVSVQASTVEGGVG